MATASARTRRKRAKAGKLEGLCGRVKADGDLCTQEAGAGTKHPGVGACRWHEFKGEGGLRKHAHELGVPLTTSPGQAITGVLALAFGNLAYVSQKVAELEEDDVFTESGGRNLWLRWHDQAMDRVAKYAAVAAGMGIAERQTAMMEAQTEMMGDFMQAVLDELSLTSTQRKKVGPAIRKHLPAVIEGRATEVKGT